MTHSKPPRFTGRWIVRGDSAYDDARKVLNTRVVAHPELIAQCATSVDVVIAVRYAKDHQLPLTVRCTGYSCGDFSSGPGLIVDLSLMNSVVIDPQRRTARVGGGMRGGDLQNEAARFGLGGPTGYLPGTGVGLILGGGIGQMASRIGYASDNVLAVELVTAAGDLVRATPDMHPDLFWAVRGTTGNFGVVTALELQLHDVPAVLAGRMLFTLDDAAGVFAGLNDCWDWPDEITILPTFTEVDVDGLGRCLELQFCHCGSEDQANNDLKLLRALGKPAYEAINTMSFRDVHFQNGEHSTPMRMVLNEQPVTAMKDQLVAALVEQMRQDVGSGSPFAEVLPRRGALQRAPQYPSALRDTGEDPTWSVTPGVAWNDPAEDARQDQWLSDTLAKIQSIGPNVELRHPNGVGIDLTLDQVAGMYGDRFDRLRDLKRQWDPQNVFRGAFNIPPATT